MKTRRTPNASLTNALCASSTLSQGVMAMPMKPRPLTIAAAWATPPKPRPAPRRSAITRQVVEKPIVARPTPTRAMMKSTCDVVLLWPEYVFVAPRSLKKFWKNRYPLLPWS